MRIAKALIRLGGVILLVHLQTFQWHNWNETLFSLFTLMWIVPAYYQNLAMSGENLSLGFVIR